MAFTSFNFLIFFILLTILYYLCPVKFKWLILLIASYFFYLNIKPVFALIVAGITLSTYFFTLLINRTSDESNKKILLYLNIILILLPLFFFKYFSSINNEMISILETIHFRWPLPEIKLLLPIGISYYTFMAIGYTIDVYNDELEAEKNLGIVALFVSFFPLILSGPIERAKNMLPQFKSLQNAEYFMIVKGIKLMLWGYFMKLVVADRIGIIVDAIYSNIPNHNGTSLLFASILYPFQMYADLGGYSLISIGSASILGINVMQNFNRPFFATSMSEFWRRWHISLIKWLTDYIYTPLSFSFRRYKRWGIIAALMITFLISGIWHGANLTFVAWGVLQGIFLSIESFTNKRKILFEKKNNLNSKAWYLFSGMALTFILFASSEVFGRAVKISDALLIFKKIFTTHGPLFFDRPSTLILSLFGLLMIMIKEYTDEFTPSCFLLFENKQKAVRLLAYSCIVILIILIGVFDGGQFIYFQF